MKLELRADKKNLTFESERVLNTKPIQLDMLVIKKLELTNIQNEIGKIFRGHNIFEYKSPKDTLNIDAYFKVLSYACLYKADAPAVDGIKSEDITLSLVHEGMPVKLIRWFEENDCVVNEHFPGIYYVSGSKVLFPLQIIISSRLGNKEHQWLKSLTSHMDKELGKRLVISARGLSDKDDKDNADSILQLAFAENPDIVKKLKEVPDMCEALMTLMKPEFDEAVSKAVSETVSKAVSQAVSKAVSEEKRLLYYELVQDGDISLQKAALKNNLTEDEFLNEMKLAGFEPPKKQ